MKTTKVSVSGKSNLTGKYTLIALTYPVFSLWTFPLSFLSYPTLPCPSLLPFRPALSVPSLPYPTLPYPTLSYPTLSISLVPGYVKTRPLVCAVIFEEELWIPVWVPTLCKRVAITIMNREFPRNDQIVATAYVEFDAIQKVCE